MNVAFTIDWLTVTFPYPAGDFFPHAFSPVDKGKPTDYTSAKPYTFAIKASGATIHWHPEHPEFKVMVRLDGQALADLRSDGFGAERLFSWVENGGGKVTRVDMAIDLLDCGGHVLDMYHAFKTSQVMTSSKMVTVFSKEGGALDSGSTVYFGSRQSDRYTRIYDKGKEQGTKLNWIRIEMELKGKRATGAIDDMQREGVEATALSYLRDAIEWSDVSWFEELFQGEYDVFALESIGRPETDTEKWVREICIPAIAKAVRRGQVGVVEALEAILQEARDKGTHGPGLRLE